MAGAEAARAAATAAGADTVLTVGGGSATGFGKAVALEQDVRRGRVPTTYAGSEMTPIWGLTDGDEKRTGVDLRVKPGARGLRPRAHAHAAARASPARRA